MKLFYHHVGQPGARADFPKTVFREVEISVVERSVPLSEPSRTQLLGLLASAFPSGRFNCWGVPAGASFVIRNLSVGDVVLLVESVHITGLVPALCEVRVFLPIEYQALSHILWGQGKYPYIFFFSAERLSLAWVNLLERLGYKRNFDPRGKFYSVSDSRLAPFGGTESFVALLREEYGTGTADRYPIPSRYIDDEIRESPPEYRKEVELELAKLRRQSLVPDPALLDDGAVPATVRLVTPRSAAFRASVKAIYAHSCAACGLKVHSPDGITEVEAAHIYPKAKRGSDDLRNGICLCRFHHWAFDVGWFSIRDNLTIIVRSDVPGSDHFAAIRKLSDRPLAEPSDKRFCPHGLFLREHRRLHGFE